jgi:hypothetical protein
MATLLLRQRTRAILPRSHLSSVGRAQFSELWPEVVKQVGSNSSIERTALPRRRNDTSKLNFAHVIACEWVSFHPFWYPIQPLMACRAPSGSFRAPWNSTTGSSLSSSFRRNLITTLSMNSFLRWFRRNIGYTEPRALPTCQLIGDYLLFLLISPTKPSIHNATRTSKAFSVSRMGWKCSWMIRHPLDEEGWSKSSLHEVTQPECLFEE